MCSVKANGRAKRGADRDGPTLERLDYHLRPFASRLLRSALAAVSDLHSASTSTSSSVMR
jgi:hypothetical protein